MTLNDLGGGPGPAGLLPTEYLRIDGRNIEYQLIPAHQVNRPTLVFLHEGLGCVAMWRDFPSRVAAATGCQTLVYSRHGHGRSDAHPNPPAALDRLQREALVVLPELLEKLRIVRPILIGHSDGASIALIHGGARQREVAGLVAMAPHEFVEDVCIEGIEQAVEAFRAPDLRERLGRYHRDADATFRDWTATWLDPQFRSWNIEEYLPAIRCPILAIQGYDDEYGTMEQIDRIAAKAGNVELLKLADCRHSPFKDQPDIVREAVVRFVTEIS